MSKLIIVGKVEEIGDLIVVNREGKTPLFKVVVTLSAPGDQLLYVDVLNKRIGEMNDAGIKKGSTVEVLFSFKGSNQADKKFNNIFCERIQIFKKEEK